ncbi:MAG: membrane integrity-associated transporter subunit PqiC [Candidatus Latescibacteria bacterium]|nr:membrane integrity-associated transporter subunit PqiC [Candidatus Latescibacterota bacterium]
MPRTLFLLLFSLTLGGCSTLLGTKTIRQQRKFTVIVQPLRLAQGSSERPYPFKVQLRKVEVSRLYDRDQLVSRLSAYEVREDRWNVWASRPSDMLTSTIERYLADAGLFAHFGREFLDQRPDYVFEVGVTAIECFASEERSAAHLALAWRLVDQRDNKIFWSDKFDREEPVYNRDIGAAVQALSGILQDECERAFRELDLRLLNLVRQQRGEAPLSLAELEHSASLAPAAEEGEEDAQYDLLYDPDKLAAPEKR